MIFNRSNASDIEKYYHGTWVKFTEFGDKLFKITSVHSTQVEGSTEDGDAFVLYLHDNFPYHVDYILPHKSLFQFKGRALLLERNPQRQYKRGLCDGNTRITDSFSGEQLGLGINYLKAFVSKPQYLTLKAFKSKRNSMTSVALSPRFACHKSGLLHVDNVAIGQVDFDKMHIAVSKVFKPEITALVGDSFTVGEL